MPNLGSPRADSRSLPQFQLLTAGLTLWNFYFELFTETIKAPHLIIFSATPAKSNTRQFSYRLGRTFPLIAAR
jgi:hypothetical protein